MICTSYPYSEQNDNETSISIYNVQYSIYEVVIYVNNINKHFSKYNSFLTDMYLSNGYYG